MSPKVKSLRASENSVLPYGGAYLENESRKYFRRRAMKKKLLYAAAAASKRRMLIMRLICALGGEWK